MAPPRPSPGRGSGEARRDPRVRCSSRHGLGAVMELFAPFVRAVAQGQPGAAVAEGDLLWNFETALRENVTIHGQPWDETEDDSKPQSATQS